MWSTESKLSDLSVVTALEIWYISHLTYKGDYFSIDKMLWLKKWRRGTKPIIEAVTLSRGLHSGCNFCYHYDQVMEVCQKWLKFRAACQGSQHAYEGPRVWRQSTELHSVMKTVGLCLLVSVTVWLGANCSIIPDLCFFSEMRGNHMLPMQNQRGVLRLQGEGTDFLTAILCVSWH